MLALRYQDKYIYCLQRIKPIPLMFLRETGAKTALFKSRKLLMITTKKWEELKKMMQLLVIIHVYVKATSGISRFFSLSRRSCF